MIQFKKDFVPLILKGEKRATVRPRDIDIKPGTTVILAAGTPFAKAVVTRVKKKKVKELTQEEIKKEGFRDFEEFFRELRSIYPSISPESMVTYIEWRIVESIKRR